MQYTKEKTVSVRISTDVYEELVKKLPDEIKIGKWIDGAIRMRMESEQGFMTSPQILRNGPNEFK